MQPVLVISSPTEGLVYINGRIAGETSPENPIILPVTPSGRIYADFRPFGRRWRAGMYRFDMRGGELDADSVDDTLRALIWPGGVFELSLIPLAAVPKESEYSVIDGMPAALLRGDSTLLRIGPHAVALPENASLPITHINLNGSDLYSGSVGNGEYVVSFSSADRTPTGVITADALRIDDGSIHTVTALNDIANHAQHSVYTINESGFELTSSEITWAESGRRYPSNGEEAALAAIEALLLGLHTEAGEYMNGVISLTVSDIDTVVSMKYAVPGPLPAIGLVNRINDRVAQITPMYFRAAKGADSRWRITEIHK